jgi:hypothetical protein
MYKLKAADMKPQHFKLEVANNVATITLNRPERKNPLTFESYAELRDTFHKFQYTKDVRAVVITGAGGNFCSGGDVHEIIGPLTKMDMTGLLEFTRMTGNLVKEMRNCPQPIIAAVDGICCGAGAIISMASDMRYATARGQDRLPFRQGRPGRLRHGRLQHPAAHHRSGPRLGTAVHRAHDERRGRPGLGLLQRHRRPGRAAGDGQRHGAVPRRRPGLRPLGDQEVPAPGVEPDHRAGAGDRGRSAGDLHADRGLQDRLSRLRCQADSPSSSATDGVAGNTRACPRFPPVELRFMADCTPE